MAETSAQQSEGLKGQENRFTLKESAGRVPSAKDALFDGKSLHLGVDQKQQRTDQERLIKLDGLAKTINSLKTENGTEPLLGYEITGLGILELKNG